MSAAEPRIYAYGIVHLRDGDNLASAPSVHGVCGSTVRALPCALLAALISDLPAQAGALLEEVWRDPDRIKGMILDHHRVLQSVADYRTVLPLRFGAVFSDDDRVATALVKHRQGGIVHVRVLGRERRHRLRAYPLAERSFRSGGTHAGR